MQIAAHFKHTSSWLLCIHDVSQQTYVVLLYHYAADDWEFKRGVFLDPSAAQRQGQSRSRCRHHTCISRADGKTQKANGGWPLWPFYSKTIYSLNSTWAPVPFFFFFIHFLF